MMEKTEKIGRYIAEIFERTTINNQYKVLTSSQNGIISQSDYFNKQIASNDNIGYKIIRRGQFTYRAMSDTGRFYVNQLKEYNIGIVSPAYPVFEVISNTRLLPEYLQEYFHSDLFQSAIALQSSGSTRVSLKLDRLKEIEIVIPPIDEQHRAIAVLKKISDLITKRRQQLGKLDELVKSRFIEMFGTVKENPYNFLTATLKEVCHKITDGKHGGCEQEANSGYYYIGAREIYDGAIHYDTAPQITYADFAKDYRRCNIEQGDMVIVNTGATIGKSAIAVSPLTERTLLQKSVALLKVKTDMVSAEFLRYCYMANPSMYMVESASAQPNLLLSKINATVIYLPPLELQEQFAAFVEQADKSKLAIQKSLDKLETLKKTLMQEYFG